VSLCVFRAPLQLWRPGQQSDRADDDVHNGHITVAHLLPVLTRSILSITSPVPIPAEHGVASRNRWGTVWFKTVVGGVGRLWADCVTLAWLRWLLRAMHSDEEWPCRSSAGVVGFVSMLEAVEKLLFHTTDRHPEP
jgi:hypothetical protein